MLERTEELSTDLEFLLASGEAELPLLAQALVEEHYASVYRLVLGVLDYREPAVYITMRTFITAALSAYRYPYGRGVENWLFQIALRLCRSSRRSIRFRRLLLTGLPFLRHHLDSSSVSMPQSQAEAELWLAFDALPDRLRVPLLMQTVMGWEPEEIAERLEITQAAVEDRLRAAGEQVRRNLSTEEPTTTDLGRLLSDSLAARWPAPELPPEDLQEIAGEVQRQVRRQAGRRQSMVRVKEVFFTGVVILLVAGSLWGYNRLNPEPEPTQTPGARREANRPAQAAAPTGAPQPTPTPVPVAHYDAQPGDTLYSLAAGLGVPLELLERYNDFEADKELPPGETIRVPIVIPTVPPSPTPVVPVAHRLEPLSRRSPPQDVHTFLKLSSTLWKTLWAEVHEIDYGPAGYNGPPSFRTTQTWISQPGQQLIVQRDAGSYRFNRSLVLNGLGFSFDLSNQREIWLDPLDESSAWDDLGELFRPAESEWFRWGDSLRVIREDNVAGRPVVIVEWPGEDWIIEDEKLELSRLILSIDAQTGVVLRLREFVRPEKPTLVREIVVSKIVYDVDFPQPDLFALGGAQKALMVRSVDGAPLPLSEAARFQPEWPATGHEPLTPEDPPTGFDPSSSLLTFQYPPEIKKFGRRSTQLYPVSLFAVSLFSGEYFLTQLEFPAPTSVVCDRSPDGRYLAYQMHPYLAQVLPGDAPEYALRLIDLHNPDEALLPLPELDVWSFAFSPDGRQIAATSGGRDAKLWLYSLQTGVLTELVSLGRGINIVWSPDGRYLSFTGKVDHLAQQELLVVNIETGEITYRAPVPDNWQSLDGEDWPPLDWPGRAWGVEIPDFWRDIEDCIR